MKIFASKRWLAACLLMMALLVTAGCQEGQGTSSSSGSAGAVTTVQEKQEPKAEKQEKKAEKPQEISTKVYYPNSDGTKLIAVKRKFKVNAAGDK